MTTLSRPTLVELVNTIHAHPPLARAVRRIADAHGIPHEVVERHLGEAMGDVIERLGGRYLDEMGDLLVHVDAVRDRVHAFYERVLNGETRTPDVSELEGYFTDLREDLDALSDPQHWASRKLADKEPVPPPRVAVAYAPAPTPPPPPVVLRRAYGGVSEPQGRAVRSALSTHRSLVHDAITGSPGARAALADALRSIGTSPEQVEAALRGIDEIRQPGMDFVLRGHGRPDSPADGGDVARAFDALPEPVRNVVRRAAGVDPDYVRATIRSEVDFGAERGAHRPWRPASMDAFTAHAGIHGLERVALEDALHTLYRVARDEVERRGQPRSTSLLPDTEAIAMRRDIEARGPDAFDLPLESRVRSALSDVPFLRELVSENPEHFANLAAGWLRYVAEREGGSEDAMTLRQYVTMMMRTQVRGMEGEFSAVFSLGVDFWVLKPPDHNVTVPGTDYVVVCRRTGEVWFADNKALRAESLSAVTSLTAVFAKNIGDDVQVFAKAGLDLTAPPGTAKNPRIPLPGVIKRGIERARLASTEIAQHVAHKTPEEIKGAGVQREIARICDRHRIRRVVSNAGGHLGELTRALTDVSVDLVRLDGSELQRPTRPLPSRKKATP